MQAPLAIAGFLLGTLAAWLTGNWLWFIGAVVMILNWPYTLFGIMPTNNRLMMLEPDAATSEVHDLVRTWGHLHAVRSALGIAAILIFLTASL
jgi:hypothetical protein